MKESSPEFHFELCRYKEKLWSFAMSYTHNADDADDLVQDTFLKAIRYAENFKQGTNLKAWLFMILKNTFLNNYRKKNLVKKIMNDQADLSLRFGIKGSENLGMGKCVMDDIHTALKNLQSQYAIPFFRYFEGYKYHEIAEELNIPIGTVKTRIHIARGNLKSNLKMYRERVG